MNQSLSIADHEKIIQQQLSEKPRKTIDNAQEMLKSIFQSAAKGNLW